eukprot:1487237-Amphidinium_carterae.1
MTKTILDQSVPLGEHRWNCIGLSERTFKVVPCKGRRLRDLTILTIPTEHAAHLVPRSTSLDISDHVGSSKCSPFSSEELKEWEGNNNDKTLRE